MQRRGSFARSWLVFIAILTVLGSGVGFAAVVNYRAFERDLRAQVEGELSAVADLKALQVAEWRETMLHDARSIAGHRLVRGAMVRAARGPALAVDVLQAEESLRSRLARLRLRRGTLVDARGAVAAATSPRGDPTPRELAAIEAARRAGGPILDATGAYAGDPFLVALPLADDAGAPVGGVLFEGDLAASLPQAVRAWPSRSRTAEVLLGTVVGSDTVLLSALRHVAPEPVPAVLPWRDGGWGITRAARGEGAFGTATDYRGARVLAAWRPVADTGWGVVVKIDEAEVEAPARDRVRWLAALVATLLVGAAGAVVAWSRAGQRDLVRREHELDARVAQQRLDYLWSQAHDIVIVADLEARIVDVNDRALDAFGYARAELIGLSIDALRAPGELEAAKAQRDGIRARREGAFETVCRRKDGSTFPAEVSARVIDVEGRPLVFSLARDISDRKQVERLARLQGALLAHLSDAVVASDRDLRLTAWTGAAEAVYGWPASGVLGRPALDVFRPETPREVIDARRARVDAGEPQYFETVHRRADGSPIQVECTWVSLRDDGGALIGYLLVSRDVSARKRAEAALRVEQERLRLAMEVTEVGVIDGDVRTGTLHVSPRLEAMLGAQGGISFARLSEMIHPEDRDRMASALDELVAGRRDRLEAEHRVVLPGGETAWCRVYARAVERDREGRALRVIATWADVSRERRLQAQLVFADRLASIGTLAAGVAHEINNPLSYLLANFEFLEARLADPAHGAPDPEAIAAVREARDGARRISGIVRGLRTFSRRDAGGGGAAQAVDLRGPVHAAIRIAEGQIKPRATLHLDLREVPPVRGSEHELAQVALNLLVNAAQATPEGNPAGHAIRVAVREGPPGRVALEIADSGCGIAPEHLPRIFDPFFTTKAVGEGSGLGLAVCHGIVEALGGEIQVESAPGKGSLFRVLLPARPAATAAAPAPPSNGAARRGRVLVVDDEALVCRAVARTLSADHEVVALTEPGEALARLVRGEPFDLVVCDLMMPGVSGMECYEALRASRPELAASMVFLTGGAFTPKAVAFLDRVPNTRIEKPFDADALRAVVARGVAARA